MVEQRQTEREEEVTWRRRVTHRTTEVMPTPPTSAGVSGAELDVAGSEAAPTLSWEELDAVARHVGVEPRQLRRAVALKTGATYRRPASSLRQRARRERFLTGGVPLLYGSGIVAPLVASQRSDEAIAALCFVLPQVLAFHLGILLGGKRKAALAGALVNACTVAAAIVSAKLRNGHVTGSAEDWRISFFLVFGGVLAGVIGAGLRQFAVARARRHAA
jgi:hypothetical protein